METKPITGHMAHFLKERDDWRFVYDAFCEARHWAAQRYAVSFPADRIEKAINMANHYANRQYPTYQMHAFPTSFQATDSVIIWREAGKMLLGKKAKEPHWRFIGGFVDPSDTSLEMASKREKNEEANINLECTDPEYIGSFRVPDPRYENSPDKIMSAVFLSYYMFGNAKAGDDIKQVRWLTKEYIRRNYKKVVMPCHVPLVELLISKGHL